MPQANLAAIARDLIEAFNAGDGDRLKKNVTSNAVYDEVGTQRRVQGAGAWLENWAQWRRAMSDVKGTITNTVTAGDTVVLEIRWEGTQDGTLELPGTSIPPSGRRITERSAMVLSFEGDKVRESRHYFDMLSMLEQLGVLPQKVRTSGR